MIKVQQAAHDIPPKGVHALSTAARGHLLRLNCVLQSHPGVQYETLEMWSAIPLPNSGALNTQGSVPIFSGHEVCPFDSV